MKSKNKSFKNKKFASLGLFSLANVMGYFGKYGIGIGFTYYKQNNNITNNETLHNETNIPLYSFHFSNNSDIPIMNDTDINSENDELNQKVFFYIYLIYVGCILISFLFYLFLINCYFGKKKKIKNEEKEKSKEIDEKKIGCCNCCLCNLICELSGFIIYLENIVLNKDSYKEEESSGCCKLCCKVISNYCNDTICNMCNCREDKRKKICCCSNYEEKHFDKDMQCFCYCYQEKSIFYWINKFCTNEAQKKIIPCIILYFISKLCTFGCQDKYENIIQKYDKLKETIIFLLSLAVSFLFFSFVMVCGRTKKGELENEFKEDENDSAPICSYRTIFFILILITIINGFDYSYTV